MSDKFTKAFIAGLGASIIMNLFNFISFYVLHFSSVRYLDYASIALYGSKPESFLAAAFAQLAQILFSGFWAWLCYITFQLLDKITCY